MKLRTRFALGFVLALLGVIAGALARQIRAHPEAGVPPSLGVLLYAVGGAFLLLGLTLAFFGKIALSPWFGIDLKGSKPAVSIGPPFMALVIGGEPRKGWCVRFLIPGTYLYISWMSRMLTRLTLAGFAARWAYLGTFQWRHTLTAGIGTFLVCALIERSLRAAFAPPPEAFEALSDTAEPPVADPDRPPTAEAISEI